MNREAFGFYPEKRFLRFGRSQQQDVADLVRGAILQSNEPYYRKKRSADLLNPSAEAANHAKNRIDRFSEEAMSSMDASGTAKSMNKREISSALRDDLDKRFMRFGRGSQLEDNLEKRFMRFGKRFMRFGREPAKRFMRFGRNWEPEKRFMRFGRTPEASKRFMRFGKRGEIADLLDQGDNVKRFYRFGKSLATDDSDSDDIDNASSSNEKRFMRFGKRFMRFGKRDTAAVESDEVHTS